MPADPHILVDLTSARNEFEAATIAAALQDRGIPATTTALAGLALGWEVAGSLPFRVQVPRGQLEAARETLRAIQAESIDIDWSEVDTSDESPESSEEELPHPARGRPTPFRWWHFLAFILIAFVAAFTYMKLGIRR